jgi:exopolysaccharide biosynthesis predicted pyruvyltransferase EpsI
MTHDAAVARKSGPEFIADMRHRMSAVLDDMVPTDRPVVHLDYPTGNNVGDAAIWLGESRYLADRGAAVRYLCDVFRYSLTQIASRLGDDGVILLHGGGNLGDLYPHAMTLRTAIIQAFPDHRIVQLPNSTHFQHDDNLDHAKRLFGSHAHLTLLLRERASYEFALREFDCDVQLCPDMAFWLGSLDFGVKPDADALWLRRRDSEAVPAVAGADGAEPATVDWGDLPRIPAWRVHYHGRRLAAIGLGEPRLHAKRLGPRSVGGMYDPLALYQIRDGCRLLQRGEVVVTDRLHGHILSLLVDRPHVLLDNSYGKVSGFFDTWTHACQLSHMASSAGEVQQMVHEIRAERR